MKKFIFIWLLSSINILINAQTVTVRDRENYQPLELVTFASQDPPASAITNARGQADLSAFNGSAVIEIRMMGYKVKRLSFLEIQNKAFQVFLEQSAISLDQVVVSATRWSQPDRDIPSRITAISTKQVALMNPQTAADLLGTSGEVYIQKSQLGGGSPMIRGFATNRLLIVVDGVRMNTAIFRGGNLQNVISIDPFAVSSTEVLFGPGGVIYGSDAIGGVMNFRTLMPRFSVNTDPLVTGSAVMRYASASNEMTGHVDVNVGWKKWAMLSSFSHNAFGNLRMGSNGPDDYLRPFYARRIDSTDVVVTNDDPEVQVPVGYNQVNLMQKVRFSPNTSLDFTYGFHYSTTTDVPRYDRLLRTRNGLPRSAEWYYGPQEWMMNLLDIQHRRSTGLYDQANVRFAYQFFEESRHDRDFNKPVRFNRTDKVDAVSANFDLVKAAGEKHRFYYGIEWVYNHIYSAGTDENIVTGEAAPGPSRYPQSEWGSYGVYLNYQFRMNEKITLQAGGRFNYFTLDATFDTTFYPFPFTTASLNDGGLSGSLGMVYHPTEQWSVNLNISTGFRTPNVDDLGKVFDSEPGSVVVPNPDLETENGYNVEIGGARVFNDFLKIDFAAYYTYLDNAMVRRDYTLNGADSIWYDGEYSQVQAMQNAAFATVYGFQAGLEMKLPHGFGLTSRFNYQEGDEELDDGSRSPLRHAAPWFGTIGLTFSADKLKLDLYANYSGRVSYENLPPEEQAKDYMYALDEEGNPYSPSWYTLNFKVMYQVTDYLSVSGGVENLTDVRYRPYSSGITAPGRNFIISLRAAF